MTVTHPAAPVIETGTAFVIKVTQQIVTHNLLQRQIRAFYPLQTTAFCDVWCVKLEHSVAWIRDTVCFPERAGFYMLTVMAVYSLERDREIIFNQLVCVLDILDLHLE